MSRHARLLVILGSLAFANAAEAQTKGKVAADFPPGAFTDGGHYKLSDFKGKVLALYFFESD